MHAGIHKPTVSPDELPGDVGADVCPEHGPGVGLGVDEDLDERIQLTRRPGDVPDETALPAPQLAVQQDGLLREQGRGETSAVGAGGGRVGEGGGVLGALSAREEEVVDLSSEGTERREHLQQLGRRGLLRALSLGDSHMADERSLQLVVRNSKRLEQRSGREVGQVGDQLGRQHPDRQSPGCVGEHGKEETQVDHSMVGDAVVEEERLQTLEHHLAVVVVTGKAKVLVQKTRVHMLQQRRENLPQIEDVSGTKKSGESWDEEFAGATDAVGLQKTIDDPTPLLDRGHDRDRSV